MHGLSQLPADPEALVGAVAALVVAFAVREVAAGALGAMGKDLWGWAKRRATRGPGGAGGRGTGVKG